MSFADDVRAELEHVLVSQGTSIIEPLISFLAKHPALAVAWDEDTANGPFWPDNSSSVNVLVWPHLREIMVTSHCNSSWCMRLPEASIKRPRWVHHVADPSVFD